MNPLKRNYLMLLMMGSLLWSACGGNPAWDGHASGNLTEQIAEEACKCVYRLMAEDERWDIDEILAEIEAEQPTMADIRDGEKLKKLPETTKALLAEEEISLQLDDSKCMKPIEEKAFGAGIDFEDWMDILDKHCKLGLFYN